MAIKCLDDSYDRDSYVYKVVRDSSYIVYNNTRSFINRGKIKKTSGFLDSLLRGLKTGVMTIRGREYSKVSGVVSRRTLIDALASVRKIVCIVDENTASLNMRYIHDTQRGFVCPVETSDGKHAGLTKYLASTAIISGYIDNSPIVEYLLSLEDNESFKLVCFNGLVIGRKNINRYDFKKLFPEASIYYNGYHYTIRTFPGRLLRPVFIKDTETIHMIDPAEQLYHSSEYTEFHEIAMVGLTAGLLPLCEHNQSARVVFGCNMIKQAIETSVMNQYSEEHRQLVYGQVPFVSTDLNDIINNDNLTGVNTVVALTTYGGWNQEDSVVVNKSAIERGLFSNMYYKKVSAIVHKNYIITQNIYEEDNEEERTICQVIHGEIKKEIINMKVPAKGIYNIMGQTVEKLEYPNVKLTITVYQFRVPQVGDKIASRNAQKSIIGRIVDEIDMPFTESGTYPDIIINPHAIPSRMTVGQLIESMVGKICCTEGTLVKKKLFEPIDMECKNDTEYLIDGRTGNYIQNVVTIGIVFYMALKPQVTDKIFSRYEGPLNRFNRQPTSGKSQEGGLRIGEMELDALLAHGSDQIINQMVSQSDEIEITLCETCRTRVHDLQGHEYHILHKQKVPMSRIITEDLFAAISIGTKVDF